MPTGRKMKTPILQHIQDNIIVGDGAMGTMLYAKGIPTSHCFEELNLSRPALVQEILREYVLAGAQAIETNSFAANKFKLARFELAESHDEINLRAIELAKAVAGDRVYVLASVGPARSRETDEISDEALFKVFHEQVEVLVSGEPDAIILETFSRAGELEIALKATKETTDLPVIAQVSVDEEGYLRDGQHIVSTFVRLRKIGAAVVGVNCAKGPAGILRALEQVPIDDGTILSAYPNAGLPAYLDGRYIYLSTPGYFADSALRFRDQGVHLIGGCCGTTPAHVKEMVKALAGMKPVTSKQTVRHKLQVAVTGRERDKRPGLLQIVKERPTFIVELDPPRDLQSEKIITGAKALKYAGADAITMADSSLGITRMSNMALGHLAHQETGLLPIIHLSCRDRNLIGTQAELMGLHALGINHVLALTGDPAKFGDQPGATSVYDLNSFNLVRMIKQLNNGVAFSGRAIGQGTDFVIGVAFNPNVKRIETQVRRLEKKVELGADFVMTQPIYEANLAKEMTDIAKNFDQPFFVGIMPLVSVRNAEFLHNEVPGIEISEQVRRRMAKYEGERARQEGVRIALEMQEEILQYFNGIYLITPFVRYEMCVQLMEFARPLPSLPRQS
jgi:homocysteine S-methyltransferase